MLLENQYFNIRITKRNREWYRNKGYNIDDDTKFINVNVLDLTNGCDKKIKIKCDYCGKIYETTYSHYYESLQNNNKKNACKNCKSIKSHEKTLKDRQNSLYNRALIICNEKNYKIISPKSLIKNNTSYIEYECNIHGIKKMRISNLISGKGCSDCAKNNARKENQLSFNEVEMRINNNGGELLNKEEYINKTTKNLKVTCPKCGNIMTTSLFNFTQHGGQICNDCKSKESLGEIKVKNYLESNNIKYEQEKWFSDCRDKKPLPFDFYLPDNKTIIEFDGRGHYEETNYFTYPLEMVKKHDNIKNEYCKKNNINLIRIPYWEIKNIDSILNDKLILHEDIV